MGNRNVDGNNGEIIIYKGYIVQNNVKQIRRKKSNMKENGNE